MDGCRDGEQSRQFLIQCAEAYVVRHPTNGFTRMDSELETLKEAAANLPIKAAAGQDYPQLQVPWSRHQQPSTRALEVIIDNTGRGVPFLLIAAMGIASCCPLQGRHGIHYQGLT